VDARGSTDLCSGWLIGCRELARYPAPTEAPRVRRAIVLTDGLANHGVVEPSAIAGHATELRMRGISTTTLGMGPGFDQHLLSIMAEAGGGNFVFIESEARLGHTFQQELGRLTTITATGVSVRLRVPDGVHGQLLSPFPVERQQRRFDVAVDDLSDGDEVALIFAIENHRRPVGDRLPFELSVRWTDPRRDARQTDRIPIESIDVVDERAFERMKPLDTVAAEAAIVRAAAAQREAMLLDQAGDFAGSRRRHQDAAALLAAAPLAAADAHLAESAREYAAYDASQAFPEHDRKQAVHLAVQRTRRARRSMDDSRERD
jgi:Ca-activated chloride channel family protein